MAAFSLDENVPPELSDAIRALGHDVLTVQADGRASPGIGDPDVLARAIELGRAVITNDRRDYHRLHRTHPDHTGIITYTNDPDRAALATERRDSHPSGRTEDERERNATRLSKPVNRVATRFRSR